MHAPFQHRPFPAYSRLLPHLAHAPLVALQPLNSLPLPSLQLLQLLPATAQILNSQHLPSHRLCQLPLQRGLLLLQLLVPLPDSYGTGVLIECRVSPELLAFFAFGEGVLELGYALRGFLE